VSLTIGRVGVLTTAGGDGQLLDDDDAAKLVQDGRQVTITGSVTGFTRPAALWQARQLLGLTDGDEPVVPCTFGQAPELDGYYRVLGANVDVQQVGNSTHYAYIPYTVTLEQVTNFRQPQVQLATAFGVRTNGRTITAVDAVQAFPFNAAAYQTGLDPDTQGTRSIGEGGGSTVAYLQDSGMSTSGSGVGAFVVPAASYYYGCCRVEHDIGSSTYRHAVGRPDFPSVTSPSSGVLRLQNGLQRTTFTYGNSTVTAWQVEFWDGSQWDLPTIFELVGFGDHGELTLYSPSVLFNTAEMAAVRFRALGVATREGLTYVDFSTRRGQKWLTVRVEGDLAPTGGWRMQFATATATTALTGGIRRTSNNAAGNRELIASATNATADNTNGSLTTTSITQETFGIGCEVAGSSATGQNTAANQMEEWFAAVSERAVVVAN
jgi:hypothetical protein